MISITVKSAGKTVKTAANQAPTAAQTVYQPLVEKVLGALGALVTHQIAYLLVSLGGSRFDALQVASLSDHAHLSTQWALVAPLAVTAVSAFVVLQLRGLGFRSAIPVRNLSGLVVGLFAVQELIEGLIAGAGPLAVFTHPAVIAGLFIGPLVAWLLCRSMAGVTELAARFVSSPPPFLVYGTQPHPKPALVRCTPVSRSGQSRPRAPPCPPRY